MAFISVASQMVALAAITGVVVAPSAPNSPTAVMASALLGGITPSTAPVAENKLIERIEVPTGAAPCPNSGAGAACTHTTAPTQSGSSAVPTGLAPAPEKRGAPSSRRPLSTDTSALPSPIACWCLVA